MIQDLTKHYAVGDVVVCERNGHSRLKAEVVELTDKSVTFELSGGMRLRAVRSQAYGDGRVVKLARSMAYEFWPVKHSSGRKMMAELDAKAAQS